MSQGLSTAGFFPTNPDAPFHVKAFPGFAWAAAVLAGSSDLGTVAGFTHRGDFPESLPKSRSRATKRRSMRRIRTTSKDLGASGARGRARLYSWYWRFS